MFGNFKDLANLPQMLQKLPEMQRKMQAVQEEIKEKLGEVRAEADAGGGMVRAVCNGRLELVSVKIDPARLDPSKAKPEDLELLEDLVVAAVAAAQTKAQAEAATVTREHMTKAAEDAGLPADLLGRLGGAG